MDCFYECNFMNFQCILERMSNFLVRKKKIEIILKKQKKSKFSFDVWKKI